MYVNVRARSFSSFYATVLQVGHWMELWAHKAQVPQKFWPDQAPANKHWLQKQQNALDSTNNISNPQGSPVEVNQTASIMKPAWRKRDHKQRRERARKSRYLTSLGRL